MCLLTVQTIKIKEREREREKIVLVIIIMTFGMRSIDNSSCSCRYFMLSLVFKAM
jgi:hypothetical protein